MKRIFVLTILSMIVSISGSIYAQSGKAPNSRYKDPHRRNSGDVPSATFAIKAGGNAQRMVGNDPNWHNWLKVGVVGGLSINVEKGIMGGQVEGLVKTVRYYIKNAAYLHLRTVSLDVPMLVTIRPLGFVPILERVKFVGGPQVTVLVSAKRANRVDVRNNFTNADFSAVLGMEVDLPLNLTVGVRGIYGLVNVNNTLPSYNWRNRSLQATLGFRFLN